MRLGVLILISYAIIAVNTRAIAKSNYWLTAMSSALFMTVNFTLIRYIAEAKEWSEFAWYLVGGVAGDLVGILISKKLDKNGA